MRVFIADGDEKVRSALRLVIDQEPSFEMDGEASNTADLLIGLENRQPELLLFDWELEVLMKGELLGLITVMYDSGVDKWLVLNIYNDLDAFRDGDDVRLWTSGTSYVVGDIAKIGGLQYVCYNAHSASSTNSPLSQDGSAYWFNHGDAPILIRDFNKGENISVGFRGF